MHQVLHQGVLRQHQRGQLPVGERQRRQLCLGPVPRPGSDEVLAEWVMNIKVRQVAAGNGNQRHLRTRHHDRRARVGSDSVVLPHDDAHQPQRHEADHSGAGCRGRDGCRASNLQASFCRSDPGCCARGLWLVCIISRYHTSSRQFSPSLLPEACWPVRRLSVDDQPWVSWVLGRVSINLRLQVGAATLPAGPAAGQLKEAITSTARGAALCRGMRWCRRWWM